MNRYRLKPQHLLLSLILTLSLAVWHVATAAPAAPAVVTAQPAATNSAPLITVAPQKSSGVYAVNEKIVWDVKLSEEAKATVTTATYSVLKGGATALSKGTLTFSNGVATIESALDTPGTLLVQVTPTPVNNEKPVPAYGGAAVDPDKIGVSAPAPDDFDAFWKAKLDELAAVPANPVLEKVDINKPGVDYWKITMDNIRGSHIRGQLARPAQGEKFPAMLIVQWAGVYPLERNWVAGPAAQGWLVLNIIAHDLPIDEPKEFYDKLKEGELKGYTAIGNDDRETSYFLRMYLSCFRAAEYLTQRPDWNGQVFVVTGNSQGGLQSFVTAGLHPKVTALMTCVPAGCDNTGQLVGRTPGWPNWVFNVKDKDPKKVLETSRYYDAVNFAARAKCPALISVGMIDTTARPEGILAAANQLKGPKEVVIMPLADHHGKNNTFAAYGPRLEAWKQALLKGQSVPPAK